MAIERKCENCAYEKRCPKYFQNYWVEICKADKLFVPKEEVVRQDERKNITNLILNSNFYIKDNGKTYEVLVNELKPKTIDTFERSIRQDALSETIKIDNDIEISLQASTYTIDELLTIIKIANNSSNIFKKYEKEK